MKNLNLVALSALLICNVVLFVELSDSNQKLEVLYLAQERAELSASLWLEKGQLLEKEKRYREAQDAYHKARLDQRTTIAGKAEKAFYASRANEIIDNPTNLDPSVITDLTKTLRSQGGRQVHLATALDIIQLTEAGQLQTATERTPSLYKSPKLGERICVYLAQRMLQRRATKNAVKLLSSCVESMPKSALSWGMLAKAFQVNDQPEEGTKAMKKSLTLDPNPLMNIEFSRSLMAAKQWEAAIVRLSILPDKKSLRSEQQRLMGACHFQLKQYVQAAASYQAAYDSQPNPKTLLSKVIALRSGGLRNDALTALNQLKSHEKALPEIRFQRGQLLAETGDTAGAAQAFTEYVRLANGRTVEKKRLTSAKSWLLKYRQSQARSAPQSPPPMPINNAHRGAPSTVPVQK